MVILKHRQIVNAGGTRRRRPARTTRGKNKRAKLRENRKRHERLFELIREQQKEGLENDSLDIKMKIDEDGVQYAVGERTDSEKIYLRWFETGDKHCDEAVKNAIIQEDKKYQDEIPWASWAKKAARFALDPQLVRRATAAGKKTWYQCKDMDPPLPRNKRLIQRNRKIKFNPNHIYDIPLINPDGSMAINPKGEQRRQLILLEDRSPGKTYAHDNDRAIHQHNQVAEDNSKTKSIPTQQQQKSQKASYKGGFIKNKTPRKTKRKNTKRNTTNSK